MDDLQYNAPIPKFLKKSSIVLNLVINGWPSILLAEVDRLNEIELF